MVSMDKTLICKDCNQRFAFTAGEQEFYQSRGLLNEPGRCPECRNVRKRERGNTISTITQHPAVCSSCGRETMVPFEPRAGRPVYCRDCYSRIKQPRSVYANNSF